MTLRTRKPTGKPSWPLILVEGGEKAGKAQPFHSRIATPTGWTTMGELAVGSAVIGADGNPTNVTAVHERGERAIYRLTFSDGATVEACDEHLWATMPTSSLHCTYNKGPKKGQRNLRPWRTMTTADLRELVLSGRVMHIPVTQPVQFAEASLPFDAYALGLLLGDGGLSKRSYPVFTSGDPELFVALAAALPEGDSLTMPPKAIAVGIKGGSTVAALRGLGLMETKSATKFIPEPYLRASVDDRLALLRGLLDTDGGMESKSITYTTVSPMLADGVRDLVRGLGGTCRTTTKLPFYTDAAGERMQGQPAQRIAIRLPVGMCPFRLQRKVDRWTELRPTFFTPPRRTVKSIDFVGMMPARCITVEAEDHLYLTNDYVVTHNSWAAAEFTASDKIGRALWLDVGEGVADDYGAVPGADYEIISHDGTWHDIVGQIRDARDEARKMLAAGMKPMLLVIDSMTALWALLKEWVNQRARSSRWAMKKLESDPNIEIKPSTNLWNDANERHDVLMRMLTTFPGVVVMTARGKEVAVIGTDGNPIEGKKDYRVEGQKNLGFSSTVWVRMSRTAPPALVGLWSVNHRIQPGVDAPKELKDFSLDWLTFEYLGVGDETQARQIMSRPEFGDVVVQARAATTREEIGEVWTLARNADYLDIATDEGLSVRDVLLIAIERMKADEGEQADDAGGDAV